jgi:predicted enzyme related to lactoylglutathione lyase
MITARMGWGAVLGLMLLQACGSGDDEMTLPNDETSGGTGGGGIGGGGAAGAGGSDDAMVPVGGEGGGGSDADSGMEASVDAGPPDAGPPPACAPRTVSGGPELHFHHVHFNTVDPEEDLAFFETYFGAAPISFCADADGNTLTRATRTERGWFLYTQVEEAPDSRLNTYLEHVGWVNAMTGAEFMRLVDLGITLYPEGRFQCPEAASGMSACAIEGLSEDYFFYVQAPSGARVEIALGPGPATSGFGHVHFIMGEDMTFFETVSDGAYDGVAIDMVNHTDVSLEETLLMSETVVDTRGKPIDHIAYSTVDLEATKTRIEGAGIEIAEDISMKPEYGFRSFFVRSPKGTWVELVEDAHFAQ